MSRINRSTQQALITTARRVRTLESHHYDELGAEAVAFVEWCSANGVTFGAGNIGDVVREYERAKARGH